MSDDKENEVDIVDPGSKICAADIVDFLGAKLIYQMP